MAEENDDLISLEDLVKDIDSPQEQPKPEPPPVKATSEPKQKTDGQQKSTPTDANQILDSDPELKKTLAAIKGEKITEPIDGESLNVDDVLNDSSIESAGGPKKKLNFKKAFQTFIKTKKESSLNAGARLKEKTVFFFTHTRKEWQSAAFHFILKVGTSIKEALVVLLKLSIKSKLAILASLALSAALVFVVQSAYRQRKIFPEMDLEYLTTFAKVADHAYEIEEGEAFEEFNSPLRHPEYMVLLDKFIVNVRHSPGASDNPMVMVELFLEAGSQEAAIEINDRKIEIRDLILSNLQSQSYRDFSSGGGKFRIKISLRKDLNTLLSKGQVRRVLFRSIILKP